MKKIIVTIVLITAAWLGVAQNKPYLNESFEDSEFPPIGWTVLAVQGDNNPVVHGSGGACGSDYSAVIMYNEYWYYGHSNRYFITPKLSPVIGDSLIFWLRTNPQFYDNTFTVEVSTGDPVASEFFVLRSFSLSDFPTSGWLRFALNMSHFAGQNIYVAFHDIQDNGVSFSLDEVSGVRLYSPDCDTIMVTDSNSYIEDFSILPECWNFTSGANSWGYNKVKGYMSHDGGLYSCSAISPILDISAVTLPYLRLAQMRPNPFSSDISANLTVSYRDLDGSKIIWKPLVTYTEESDVWRYDSVALPTDISHIQLKFNAFTTSTSSYNHCYFDNVTVYNNVGATVNTDPSVTTRAASNVQSNTATLNGTINNAYYVPLISMGFEWKDASDSVYTNVFTNTPQLQIPTYSQPISLVLTDLSVSTEYTYRTFITYNDTTIYGDAVSFSTYSCDAPTGLHATDVGLDYINLEWDDVPGINAWQVCFGAGGEMYGVIGTTETNSYTFPYSFVIYYESAYHTGHSPLYYDFKIRPDCGDSTWGPWSNVITVATAYVGVEERQEKSVTLYPNPATSYLDVRVDGDMSMTGMEVYDAYGKLVYRTDTQSIAPMPAARIDVSDLSSGIYFVRVKTNCGQVTKKFVKR